MDLVGSFRGSVEDYCERGAFVDLQIELRPDGETDPLERVAQLHPASELANRTQLKRFLNQDYYRTGREDFPVSSFFGWMGSLLVLVVLVGAWFGDLRFDWGYGWCLALGLVVADVVQHLVHLVTRPKLAPVVHLITIVGVIVPLIPLSRMERLGAPLCLALLALGGVMIFGNWTLNSLKVRRAPSA